MASCLRADPAMGHELPGTGGFEWVDLLITPEVSNRGKPSRIVPKLCNAWVLISWSST